MKCPRCWAEKAYVRKVGGLKGFLLDCLLLVPLKCHHCYHKFTVSWFATIGRRIHPPKLRTDSKNQTPRHSVALSNTASRENHSEENQSKRHHGRDARARAA